MNPRNNGAPQPATPPASDLIARYLHAVGKYLPANRRADILAEISANLLAEVDDREAELGRPLTSAEQSDLLKAHGRPFIVAAGYRPQQYLIGPALFPYYFLVLKVAITLCAFVYFLVNSILLAVNGFTVAAAVAIVFRFPFTALITALWVTVVFAALEYAAPRYISKFPSFGDWKPEALPPIDSPPTKPFATIFDLFANLVGILWLTSISHFPYLILGPGAKYLAGSPIRATPALQALYWPIIGVLCAQLAVKAIVVARSFTSPALSKAQKLLLRIFNTAIGVVILIMATRVREYLIVVGDAAAQARYRHLAEVLNTLMNTSIRVWLAVCIFMIFWELGRYYFKIQTAKLPAWRQHVQL